MVPATLDIGTGTARTTYKDNKMNHQLRRAYFHNV